MTLSNEIINVLEFLGGKFGIAIDWTSANVIPYVQELIGKYISWEIATSITWGIIGALFLILGIVLIIIDCKAYCEGVLIVFGAIFSILGVLVMGTQIFDILKCIYFPELQVIDYVKMFMAQNN